MKKRPLPFVYKAYLYLNGIWGVLGVVVLIWLMFTPWKDLSLSNGVEEGGNFGSIQSTKRGVLLKKYRTGLYSSKGEVYGYEFTTLDVNETKKWVSYGGATFNKKEGAEIQIEVSSKNPKLYRIQALASDLPESVSTGMVILTILVIGFIVIMFMNGRHLHDLVMNGGYTNGEIYKRKKIDQDEEGNKTFNIHIRYKKPNGAYSELVVSTDDKSTYRLGSKRPLFYSYVTNNEAVLLQDLPILTRDYISAEWVRHGILPK